MPRGKGVQFPRVDSQLTEVRSTGFQDEQIRSENHSIEPLALALAHFVTSHTTIE